MAISEALIISLIGICVVMLILAIIAVLIILVSKVIRTIEAKAKKPVPAESTVPSPAVAPVSDGTNIGEVELIGTDEKTAAVIMAIVSQKSEIPLDRLQFKSIRLLEDSKKGDVKNG